MAIVEFKKVTRVYRMGDQELRTLDNVSFELNESKIVVILGSSEAGKSTLLNLLGVLDSPTSGSIRVNGKTYPSFPAMSLQTTEQARWALCSGFTILCLR